MTRRAAAPKGPGARKAKRLEPSTGWGPRWASLVASLAEGRPESARECSVASLEVERGHVRSRVRGPSAESHEVRVTVHPLPEAVYERAIRTLAARASFTASLLAGRFPDEVEAAFAGTGRTLLPGSAEELDVSCTCAESGWCRHSLAVLERTGELLHQDPFLAFLLRGRTRDELLEALKRQRATTPASPPREAGMAPSIPREPLPDLSARPELFYKPGSPLASLRLSFNPPEHPEAVLTRLGQAPFSDPEAAQLLIDLHRAIGQGAAERLDEWEWRRLSRR